MKSLSRLTLKWPRWQRYLCVLFMLAVDILWRDATWSRIGYSRYLLSYPVVLFSCYLFGLGPGLLALGLALPIVEVLRSMHGLHDAWVWPDEYVRAFVFMGVGLLICWMTAALRSARNRAERAARELNQITQAVPQIVFRANEKGSVLFFNDRWYEYTGVSKRISADQVSWNEFCHPDDLDAIQNALQKATANKAVFEAEYRLRRSDGTYRWHLGRSVPALDPATGQIQGWIGTATDIEDQKRAFRASRDLEESERRFQVLTELVPQFVWMGSPDGRNEYANQHFYDFVGVERGAGMELGWLELFHPDDRDETVTALHQYLAAGRPYELETRFRRHDGVYRWMQIRAFPLKGVDGEISRWFGVCSDIDDQKRAEERQKFLDEATVILATSLDLNETLRAVSKLASDRLADWCTIERLDEGKFECVALNHRDKSLEKQGWEYRLSFPPDGAHEGAFNRVVRTGEAELHAQIPEDAIRAASISEEHFNVLQGLGFRSSMLLPIRMAQGTFGILAMFTGGPKPYDQEDFSLAQELARRAALAIDNALLVSELKDKKTALTKAVQMRDDFMSIASHELKTPLTSLRLQAQMRLQKLARGETLWTPNKLREMFLADDRHLIRLERLIEDMLDISRLAEGRLSLLLEEVELASLIRDVLERFGADIERSGCELNLEASLPVRGRWDKYRIEQVVANLLSNALKYASGKPLWIRSHQKGDYAVLEFEDRGCGIALEDHERIFNRFERAVPAREIAGLGLGLFIAKEILELHQGGISVKSEPGAGTTFTVRLPLECKA